MALAAALVAGAVLAAAPADPTDTQYFNEESAIRRGLKGKYAGKGGTDARILVPDFVIDFLQMKVDFFNEFTGADCRLTATTQASWLNDIKDDLKTSRQLDAYFLFGNWIPTLGGLEPITKRVQSQDALEWTDVWHDVRMGAANFAGETYAMPLDGDVIAMAFRSGLLEGVGRAKPNTWEEMLDTAALLHGMDHNGDGERDYGICLSSAESDISGTLFWAVAAPYLQRLGPEFGYHFNASTMEPAMSAQPEAFEAALDTYRQLMSFTSFSDRGEYSTWKEQLALFSSGRCAILINYLGPLRMAISTQEANNLTDIRLARLPGVRCPDAQRANGLCNFAEYAGDDLVNFVPMLASGGKCVSIRASAEPAQKDVAYDLMAFLSDPVTSFHDVANPGSLFDPARRSHVLYLDDSNTVQYQAFVSNGWLPAQLADLKLLTKQNFEGRNSGTRNAGLDLRIQGSFDYIETTTVRNLHAMLAASNTTDTTVLAKVLAGTRQAIAQAWEATTDLYGRESQLRMYRASLGLSVAVTEEEAVVDLVPVIVPIVTVSVVAIAALFAWTRYQQWLLKTRTRDISRAPVGSAEIAMLFTDIQQSTRLWDLNRTAMAEAVEAHHNCMRQCIHEGGGYEVKTIGDAFMVAHSDPEALLKIAANAQMRLMHVPWPAALMRDENMVEETVDVDGEQVIAARGLRVRMGIAYGPMNCKFDKVAKGFDYYGETVNCASRVEACAWGGQIVVTRETLSNMHAWTSQTITERWQKLGYAVKNVGPARLRGISGTQDLWEVAPAALKHREFEGVRRVDADTAAEANKKCYTEMTAEELRGELVSVYRLLLGLKDLLVNDVSNFPRYAGYSILTVLGEFDERRMFTGANGWTENPTRNPLTAVITNAEVERMDALLSAHTEADISNRKASRHTSEQSTLMVVPIHEDTRTPSDPINTPTLTTPISLIVGKDII